MYNSNTTPNIVFNNDILNHNVFVPVEKNVVVKKKRKSFLRSGLFYPIIVTMLILASIMTCLTISKSLTLRISLASKQERIATLERIHDKRKQENDSLANAIDNKYDHNQLLDTAVLEFGMHYPYGNEIIRYTKSSGEYVRQYENIK